MNSNFFLKLVYLILFLSTQLISSQESNSKEVVKLNKVKSVIKQLCFSNGNGGCTVYDIKYDRKGNVVESGLGRVGSFNRYVYDENNRKIKILSISRGDEKDISVMVNYYYTEKGELLFEKNPDNYEVVLDKKGRIIKLIEESKYINGNDFSKTTYKSWFKNIKPSEIIVKSVLKKEGEVIEVKNEKTVFGYDNKLNLIFEKKYINDTLSERSTYKYDNKNRIKLKIYYDKEWIESINEMKFSDRENIKYFRTDYAYNSKGQVVEMYDYYFDICMSIDNHYDFKYKYLENGLIDFISAYENGELEFSIYYEYEFFD